MKLIKTANGKKQIKISKSEWENIGKKAGWEKKAQDQQDQVEDLFEQYQTVRKDKPIYVSIYEVSQAYGGPEEGGWWYSHYELKSSKKFYDREEAEKFAEVLENGINAEGLNDESLSSSRGLDQYPDPSGGDPMYEHSDADIPVGFSGLAQNYVVSVEDQQGELERENAPHYE